MSSVQRNVSWVWQFFDKINSELARCVICHKEYSFKSNQSNLKKHLDSKHDTCGDDSFNDFPETLDKKPLDLGDEDRLKSDDEPEARDGGEDEESRTMDTKIRYSALWNHFEETEPRRAKCLHCSRTLALSASSIGTLSRHMNAVHPTVDIRSKRRERMVDDASSGTEREMNPGINVDMRHKRSQVWFFFKCLDNKFAQCKVCARKLSYATTVSNLRKHLRKQHSDIELENVMTERDSSDDENADRADDFMYSPMEEVFLKSAPDSEDRSTSPPSRVQKNTWEEDRRPSKRHFTVDRSRHSLTRKRRERTDGEDSSNAGDEIEHFGRYVTVLLRKLPRPLAGKMQMDIVTLIMKAQLDYEAKQTAAQGNTVGTSERFHRVENSPGEVDVGESI